jgi:glycosyltransferase involved in cell wall biosynthesis
MMTYSIVIPALNEEKHIATCIKQVQQQAPSAELLLVDGRSEDNTVAIAKKLGAKVLVEPKKTVAAARNTGLQHAQGGIVCFIDADVVPEKNWFKQLTVPFEDSKVMAVAGIPKPMDGTRIEEVGMQLIFGALSSLLFKFNIPLVSGQVMAVRRQDALHVGGFNTDHKSGEDTYIFLMLRKRGKILHSSASVRVSLRRIRRWGLLRYLSFNIRNYVSLLRDMRPLEEEYDPIRL